MNNIFIITIILKKKKESNFYREKLKSRALCNPASATAGGLRADCGLPVQVPIVISAIIVSITLISRMTNFLQFLTKGFPHFYIAKNAALLPSL